MRRMKDPRRAVFCAKALMAASLLTSCGARTELVPEREVCPKGGETRPCESACGLGQQICTDGSWQACEAPTVTRACSNACGVGQQSCTSGRWDECAVPETTRSCTDACGTGSQSCRQGRWLACQTPETTRPCADPCGEGVERCRAGAWGSCEVEPVPLACESVCGTGYEICERGSWRACNAPQPKPPTLLSVIRDFNDTHTDFEIPAPGDQLDLGLVEFFLGQDGKPVYANKPNSRTTSGAFNFDQWYRDVPAVNLSTAIDLQLEASVEHPGMFVYDDDEFFPIDGALFGNQGRRHNYHFTLEARTRFQYLGGEVFRFTGDDDMWVFVNRRLAIDLGGVHTSMAGAVELDRRANELGLTRGGEYELHFFFAERKTVDSHFKIETSISEPGSCD